MFEKIPFSLDALKANPMLHVQTRNGTPVDLVEQQLRNSNQPIVGIVRYADEEEECEDEVMTWSMDGHFFSNKQISVLDLVLTL